MLLIVLLSMRNLSLFFPFIGGVIVKNLFASAVGFASKFDQIITPVDRREEEAAGNEGSSSLFEEKQTKNTIRN